MPVVAKGLEGIIANSTRLSDVLGDIGQLIYAGYDINELAGKVSFEEVVHLLWYGELPNWRQLNTLNDTLRAHRDLPRRARWKYAAMTEIRAVMPTARSRLRSTEVSSTW